MTGKGQDIDERNLEDAANSVQQLMALVAITALIAIITNTGRLIYAVRNSSTELSS
jgi:hypothetical protein